MCLRWFRSVLVLVATAVAVPSLQHAEANIAKQQPGCAVMIIYLCFIMLNMLFRSRQPSHPSLVHAEVNIAKRLLGCTILSIFYFFITLNVFVSQQAAVRPIPGAANCKVTTQVCPIDHLFMFYSAKHAHFAAGSHRSVAYDEFLPNP